MQPAPKYVAFEARRFAAPDPRADGRRRFVRLDGDKVAIDRVVGVFGDRGWWDGAKLTSAGREVRDGIEAATDASQVRLVENLGDDIERVIETLSTMAVQMIEAGAFTDDPRKRAAG